MQRHKHFLFAAALALPVCASSAEALSAQDFMLREPKVTLGARFGYSMLRAQSEIFAFTQRTLTVEKSDFNGGSISFDVGVSLGSRMAIAASVGFEGSETDSEFREFVGDDDLPIEQSTRFRRVPFTVGARIYPGGRGKRISRLAWIPSKLAPYFEGGGGLVWYEFKQVGEFVDYDTNDIFVDHFTSSAAAGLLYAAAGLDFSLGPKWILTGEARYSWAEADLKDDFVGFDEIDLSGLRAMVGFAVRL